MTIFLKGDSEDFAATFIPDTIAHLAINGKLKLYEYDEHEQTTYE